MANSTKRIGAASGKEKNIEKTLRRITGRQKAPIITFIVLLLLYLIASVIAARTARSQGVIVFGEAHAPITLFAGVFSSLANICIICLVVFFGKLGFFTSLVLLVIQFLPHITYIITQRSLSSIPGVFTNILTIVAINVLYLNQRKIDKYQVRLRDQAVTDRMTGLPNRFACSELIDELVKNGERFAVCSIDLNHFKSINDTMGHNTGNAVLIEIASRWKAISDSGETGTIDFVTRQGGDEFTLLIRNYRTREEVEHTILCYQQALEKKMTIDNCDFFLTASFGYAEFPVDTVNADTLFSFADAAMYEVKRAVSNAAIRHFTPDLMKNVEHTLEMERMIRTALDQNLFYFMLQPQFGIDHKLRGFEALARMKDAAGRIISPGEFIPVAEKAGLIDRVDISVFRNSAQFLGEVIRKTGTKAMLSVNISVRHLMKNDFLEEVQEILRSSGVPAGQLEIEITESIMIDSAEKALACINAIRDMGIKIAIDDFGTGYSSLSYLSNFPANLLKVDKSFIDKMNSSDSSKQYVAAIISIGHIMNYEVISEGVEESDQLETLRSIGCDYIQGFIWGKPLSPEAAEELVYQSMQSSVAT